MIEHNTGVGIMFRFDTEIDEERTHFTTSHAI